MKEFSNELVLELVRYVCDTEYNTLVCNQRTPPETCLRLHASLLNLGTILAGKADFLTKLALDHFSRFPVERLQAIAIQPVTMESAAQVWGGGPETNPVTFLGVYINPAAPVEALTKLHSILLTILQTSVVLESHPSLQPFAAHLYTTVSHHLLSSGVVKSEAKLKKHLAKLAITLSDPQTIHTFSALCVHAMPLYQAVVDARVRTPDMPNDQFMMMLLPQLMPKLVEIGQAISPQKA